MSHEIHISAEPHQRWRGVNMYADQTAEMVCISLHFMAIFHTKGCIFQKKAKNGEIGPRFCRKVLVFPIMLHFTQKAFLSPLKSCWPQVRIARFHLCKHCMWYITFAIFPLLYFCVAVIDPARLEGYLAGWLHRLFLYWTTYFPNMHWINVKDFEVEAWNPSQRSLYWTSEKCALFGSGKGDISLIFVWWAS